MRINSFISILILALFLLSGCSSTGKKSGHALREDASAATNISEQNFGRFIIRSANISLKVNDLPASTARVEDLVADYAGYVVSLNENAKAYARVEVKIPNARLDDFVSQLADFGEVTSKWVSSRDVTEEMIDIDARIKNLVDLRARYRELLAKATKVSEMIEIEQQLSSIQSQLDSIDGRRKSLMGRVEMSDVTITIEEKTVYGPLGYLSKGVFWVVKKLFVIK